MHAIETSRRHLGELAAMQAQVHGAEGKILERAQARLLEVSASIGKLRPAALSGEAQAGADYQAAIAEQGQLHIVIAQARKNLGGAA